MNLLGYPSSAPSHHHRSVFRSPSHDKARHSKGKSLKGVCKSNIYIKGRIFFILIPSSSEGIIGGLNVQEWIASQIQCGLSDATRRGGII